MSARALSRSEAEAKAARAAVVRDFEFIVLFWCFGIYCKLCAAYEPILTGRQGNSFEINKFLLPKSKRPA
jgi:hypothetical protein